MEQCHRFYCDKSVIRCLRFSSLFFYSYRLLNGRAYLGVFLSLCIAAVSLCLFQVTSKWGLGFNFLFLFVAGACQCGPDSVISGALASEIGTRENAQSAVSGVINGKLYSIL